MKTFLLSILVIAFAFVADAYGQKATVTTKVCGDPSAACAKRALFDDDDLPFEFNQGSIVAESAPFYAVILKSIKLTGDAECEKTPVEFSVRNIQYNFLKNKVFVARGCYSIENNYYTNVGDNVIALAVYAGSTKAAADAFLRKVKSADYLDAKDAYLLKISTGFNGT